MMEYSASSVKYLLWFMETKDTVRLLQNHSMTELREIILQENVYQQKSKNRIINEFGCIKRRIEAVPEELMQQLLVTDVGTAKLITLISAMASDRMLFELVYEVIREKMRLGEDVFTEADLNIFFGRKQEQDEKVAKWTETTVKKLKTSYTKFLSEAGLLTLDEKKEKHIAKPYIEDELRTVLLKNNMQDYLYALTGEQ